MSERVHATVWLCPAVGVHGVWTDEAVAGLVGQDVKMHGDTYRGQHTEFAATVTAAAIVDGQVTVEMALPPYVTRLAPVDSAWWNETTTGRRIAPPPDETVPDPAG